MNRILFFIFIPAFCFYFFKVEGLLSAEVKKYDTCLLSNDTFLQSDADTSNVPRQRNFPRSIEYVDCKPHIKNTWVFFLAGQSNMAGRAFVEPMDTIPYQRIFSLSKDDRLVLAKEPLHFNEPGAEGLDCGLSFAINLQKAIPDSINILLMPIAVGGSSIEQWIGDSTHRGVRLLSNFHQKVDISRKYGVIKGILWHQGENDGYLAERVPRYERNLGLLFAKFRKHVRNDSLPILAGELGSFLSLFPNGENYKLINEAIKSRTKKDQNTFFVRSTGLTHLGDSVHFDSRSQRELGARFAKEYINGVLAPQK